MKGAVSDMLLAGRYGADRNISKNLDFLAASFGASGNLISSLFQLDWV